MSMHRQNGITYSRQVNQYTPKRKRYKNERDTNIDYVKGDEQLAHKLSFVPFQQID